MIPGLSSAGEARLQSLLDPRATSLTPAALSALPTTIYGALDEDLARLGIVVTGNPDLTVVVTDPTRPVGTVRIEVGGGENVVFFDNRAAGGQMYAAIRMLGSDNAILFDRLGQDYIALHDVFLRSTGQMLFWGAGATAVGCSIEMEGEGRTLMIGEDALISSGIWIRNHDMHAVHDLASGQRINRPPVDTVIERHVWLGQNAMLHCCQRIGMGSIVGAMSLVKGVVGTCMAVAGVPARPIRHQVSWGRSSAGMTRDERAALGYMQDGTLEAAES
jgi:hypothetical protein